MRLISADKLVDMLYDNEFCTLCPLDEVSSVIDDCPTVDAVPVVRCKDCKFNSGAKKCLNPNSFIAVPADDDYCSYGEKRA